MRPLVTAEEIAALIAVAAQRQLAVFSPTICAQTIAALVAERLAVREAEVRAEERQSIEVGFSVRSEMLAKWLGEYIEADDKPVAYQRMLDSVRTDKAAAVAEARAGERKACVTARAELQKMKKAAEDRLDEVRDDAEKQAETIGRLVARVGR